MKDMRFGVKYLPRNDLCEEQLLKIIFCDWPNLNELRLSTDMLIEEIILKNLEKNI